MCVCTDNKIMVVVNDERTCYQLREVSVLMCVNSTGQDLSLHDCSIRVLYTGNACQYVNNFVI